MKIVISFFLMSLCLLGTSNTVLASIIQYDVSGMFHLYSPAPDIGPTEKNLDISGRVYVSDIGDGYVDTYYLDDETPWYVGDMSYDIVLSDIMIGTTRFIQTNYLNSIHISYANSL